MVEVYGSIESIKKSIEKKYLARIKSIEKDISKQIDDLRNETNKKTALDRAKIKTNTDSETKKVYSRVMSEEKLKAKKEFEEKREELINNVFKEAEKKSLKIAHSNDYIGFVKSKKPALEETEATADSNDYKKSFPELEKWKIDKNIVGIKFVSHDVIYDFTLDNLLKSQRSVLRQIISKELFGG